MFINFELFFFFYCFFSELPVTTSLTILVPASIVHIGNRHQIGHYFYDVLQVKCSAYAALIENMSMTFISNKWETAMTSHGHVTTALLTQANKEYYRGAFFIRLHLKKLCASVLETSHSK